MSSVLSVTSVVNKNMAAIKTEAQVTRPTIDRAALLPEKLRDDFPILGQDVHGDQPLVFLDNAASTQRPRQVIDVLRRVYERDYANVHRGIHTLSERSTAQYEEAREKVQAFIGAVSPQEIIFTAGSTDSINTVARSWGDANIRAGDEIVLSVMEHHSNLVPWQQLAVRRGAVLRHIPITDDGQLILESLDTLLTERTKLVAVASVSNVLGTINPVPEIARRAHAAGALVLIDAAQSVPHMPTNVAALNADFIAFSGHKMLGPTGIGVLWGREKLLDAMPPFRGGGSMINRVYLDHFTPAELPAKFEAGTPPIAPAIALGAAIDYLNVIGIANVQRHEHELVRYAYERLLEIDGLKILGPPPEKRAGLVSFTLPEPHPHDVAQLLDQQGIAVRAGHHCTQPLHDRLNITASSRASFYLYNTPAEVDLLVDVLSQIRERFRPKGRKRK
jgi:cysteine desulfurase / selenocysteine lyase